MPIQVYIGDPDTFIPHKESIVLKVHFSEGLYPIVQVMTDDPSDDTSDVSGGHQS